MSAEGAAALVAFAFVYVVVWANVGVRSAFAKTDRSITKFPPPVDQPKHFDTPTKSCYEYGCTDDCPVAALHRTKSPKAVARFR